MIFLLKFLLKSASKSSVFRFGVEICFLELQIAASCVADVRKPETETKTKSARQRQRKRKDRDSERNKERR